MTTQLLNRFDAAQGHESKQDKDVKAPIVPLDLAPQLIGSLQQTAQQKRRQSAQYASLRDIQARFKPHGGTVANSESRKGPLFHPSAGRAHALGSLRINHVP